MQARGAHVKSGLHPNVSDQICGSCWSIQHWELTPEDTMNSSLFVWTHIYTVPVLMRATPLADFKYITEKRVTNAMTEFYWGENRLGYFFPHYFRTKQTKSI